jgi:hypothetical protein
MKRIALSSLFALFVLAGVAWAYRVGETVYFTATFPDVSGIATTPTWMKAYVYDPIANAVVDSTDGYGTLDGAPLTGIAGIPLANSKTARVYKWSYAIPNTNAWRVYTGNLHVFLRGAATGISLDQLRPIPALIPVNYVVADTLSAAAINDFWIHDTNSTEAVVDATDTGLTTVTYAGSPVAADVFVYRDSKRSIFAGRGRSDTQGKYYVTVPLNPTAPDSFWVSAWYANRWVKNSERVIF